jgi:hypothetical protein
VLQKRATLGGKEGGRCFEHPGSVFEPFDFAPGAKPETYNYNQMPERNFQHNASAI